MAIVFVGTASDAQHRSFFFLWISLCSGTGWRWLRAAPLTFCRCRTDGTALWSAHRLFSLRWRCRLSVFISFIYFFFFVSTAPSVANDFQSVLTFIAAVGLSKKKNDIWNTCILMPSSPQHTLAPIIPTIHGSEAERRDRTTHPPWDFTKTWKAKSSPGAFCFLFLYIYAHEPTLHCTRSARPKRKQKQK